MALRSRFQSIALDALFLVLWGLMISQMYGLFWLFLLLLLLPRTLRLIYASEDPDRPTNPEFRKKFDPRGIISGTADGPTKDEGIVVEELGHILGFGLGIVKRVGHTDTVHWHLLIAVDALRQWNAQQLVDRRRNVRDVVGLWLKPFCTRRP